MLSTPTKRPRVQSLRLNVERIKSLNSVREENATPSTTQEDCSISGCCTATTCTWTSCYGNKTEGCC